LPYDLVLMDVMLPEMDGSPATSASRACAGAAAPVPVVGPTANVRTMEAPPCRTGGSDAPCPGP
jgi:CheY-like chemotaxis protein